MTFGSEAPKKKCEPESDAVCEHEWVKVSQVFTFKGGVLHIRARIYLTNKYSVTPKVQNVYECRKCGDTLIDPP